MQLTIEDFSPRGYEARFFRPSYYSEPGPDSVHFEYPVVINSEEELDQFLGDVISSVGHAIGSVASAVDKVIPVSKIIKPIEQVVSDINKVVPVSLLVPGGIAFHFIGDAASRIARGENVFNAIASAGKGAWGDVRKGLQLASMVSSFVPGIGTGISAALGAASALANGEPITDAIMAAARDALPGGEIVKTAFDMATNLAKGKNVGEALLNTVRSQVPDNPLAQAAFDTGLALAKGKNIQQALLSSAGKLLPKSPFAENALAFVNKAMSGQNIQTAALSKAGHLAYQQIQKTGSIHVPGVGLISLKHAPSKRPSAPLPRVSGKIATPSVTAPHKPPRPAVPVKPLKILRMSPASAAV